MTDDYNILDHINSIHFTGIGGIGMSALAEILKHDGYSISGSDINTSPITDRLESMGIIFRKGNCADFVGDCDLLVYTAAVKQDNPELTESHRRGIATIERAELLGCVQRKYPKSIAVAGTHGKTTVTSMISCILLAAGVDPTICAGGIIPNIGSNARASKSDYFVCEACEYVDSFLHLAPRYSVITNIEHDHTDYFKTQEDVTASFTQFIKQTTESVIINAEDANSLLALERAGKKGISFGIEKGDFTASGITFENGIGRFDIMHHGKSVCSIRLSVPGMFNIRNALAAAALSLTIGIEPQAVAEGLSAFRGASRRFEYIGSCNGAAVYDDYAHHPREMYETLSAAKLLGFDRVICVFQPHTYTRTAAFLKEMAQSLSVADCVVLAPIYAARETNETGISSDDLAQLIDDSVSLQSFDDICDYLKSEARRGDIVMIMGAGNINTVSKMIVNHN